MELCIPAWFAGATSPHALLRVQGILDSHTSRHASRPLVMTENTTIADSAAVSYDDAVNVIRYEITLLNSLSTSRTGQAPIDWVATVAQELHTPEFRESEG